MPAETNTTPSRLQMLLNLDSIARKFSVKVPTEYMPFVLFMDCHYSQRLITATSLTELYSIYTELMDLIINLYTAGLINGVALVDLLQNLKFVSQEVAQKNNFPVPTISL